MHSPILLSLIGVLCVSGLSFLGILFFLFDHKHVGKILLPLVGFSTGALLGDVFLHILPDLASEATFARDLWIVLLGILCSFIIEKFVHWRHCHLLPDDHEEEEHHHTVGIMSVTGESVHNFIDGLVIAASFLVSVPIGISTTLAVIFHEIPHEVGNMAVLLHSGFSRKRALFLNVLSACAAILGALLTIALQNQSAILSAALLPFAAGNLLYIAGSDLIPELHRETRIAHGLIQLLCICCGIGAMAAILLVE